MADREYSFYVLTQFSKRNNVGALQLLTLMVFFQEIHVSLQFTSIGLFSIN
jgi:hypothetical protein